MRIHTARKRAAALLALILLTVMLLPTALAEGEDATNTPEATLSPEPTATPELTVTPEPTKGDARVTMGADLTDKQRAAVYQTFGITEGSVIELKVTNAEERKYLEGLVPDGKIGSVALSCLYIRTMDEGYGLTIELNNINYCTVEMYKSALTTAGITDASVIVSAPFPVSGTGALTGAYKAYEDITGVSLSELAKSVGAEELVVTGELAEFIGSEDALELVKELKGMLDQTQGMSDDEVRKEIRSLADTYGVALTTEQLEKVLSLVRNLEGLDAGALQDRLTALAKTAQTVNKAGETVTKVAESVKSFFASVGKFFTDLFGKKG